MKRLSLLILSVLTCLPALFQPVQADVIVRSEVDSMMMWVGQQTGLYLEVTCDPGQTIEFPAFRDTVVKGLEIIPPVLTDTQYLNKESRMTVRRKYLVTCFDSALIYIPPMPVTVDGVQYESDPQALAFITFDIPEGSENEIFGPKDVMKMPVAFREIRGSLLTMLILAIAILLTVYLFVRYNDNLPVIRRIKVEPKVPAHVRALDGIEQLRQSGDSHGQDPKRYYTCLTDILREYINERFGFNATEMTSDEILDHLRESQDKESLTELASLLETSDMVKFAKFIPLLGENDRNLMGAMEFVKDTMIEVPEEEMQPKIEETVVQEKRSRGARIALLAAAIAVLLVSVFLLVRLIVSVYYLLF
ncbi:MAG: hypothetical protein KBT49_07455 [Bacteroidetes bacterium]|nr:hypothetical protein [Candidatus Colenecus caballi]